MKSFKQHILEKLRVSSKSDNIHKEYKDKTKEVTKYTAYKYHKYILDLDSIVLFMDYWYYFLESEDEGVKEKLDLCIELVEESMEKVFKDIEGKEEEYK